jgi:hypothetical protein
VEKYSKYFKKMFMSIRNKFHGVQKCVQVKKEFNKILNMFTNLNKRSWGSERSWWFKILFMMYKKCFFSFLTRSLNICSWHFKWFKIITASKNKCSLIQKKIPGWKIVYGFKNCSWYKNDLKIIKAINEKNHEFKVISYKKCSRGFRKSSLGLKKFPLGS